MFKMNPGKKHMPHVFLSVQNSLIFCFSIRWQRGHHNKKNGMISAFLSVSLLVAFLVGAVDATTLRVQEGSPTCSGQFELTSFAYDCGDECTPGVGVEIAGSSE